MQIDLSQKTALVTGSTHGIGFAIATGLARAGATVIINGRKPDRVDAALAELVRSVDLRSRNGAPSQCYIEKLLNVTTVDQIL